MKSLRGVLLDVDGTLVDSNDAHAHAWVKAFGEHGLRVNFDAVRQRIGKGSDKLLPEVSGLTAESPRGKAISDARQAIFLREQLPRLRPFPKVRELLARMKQSGLRLTVASSAKKPELERLLSICGAHEFLEAKTSSDDAENSKPDPDIILAALKEAELDASDAVLVGDTPYDLEAATRAGVAMIALRCGGWKDVDFGGALAIYDDPADLLDQFDKSPLSRSALRERR